ncbi:MAG: xly 5, partial [Verrucomicrobiaceae bacterium]|nr:xly 5 [Verrucomicrobiaceae bacterium]
NSPGRPEEFGDALKEQTARAEKNIDLMLSHHVYKVEMNDGPTKTIRSVTALDVKAGAEKRIRGKFFCDATGHGTVGALAGAEFTMLEKGHMGMSNMWVAKKTATPSAWPKTPWALPLKLEDFPAPKAMEPVGKKNAANQKGFDLGYTPMESPHDSLAGEWFWEGGFDRHPLKDLELVRDWNFRAVFGAFSAMRKLAPEKYGNYDMQWLAYVGGTRESRLLQGDVVLSPDDIVGKREFNDGCVPTTWDLDLHYPKEQYAGAAQGFPFISRAQFGKGVDKKQGYPVPYRCFYSKNIENMFMAGRCISVTHEALGTVRVMRTCGMMGEVVGKAAYLTVRHQTTPRGVYDQYLDDLKDLMRQPGAMRRDNLEAALYLPANAKKMPEVVHDSLDAKTLEGIVIDDADAELTGKWTTGEGLKGFVGEGYRYTSEKAASARFAFAVKQSGKYEVRLLWQPHENRAKNTPVSVLSAGGEKSFVVDESKPGALDKGFHSLGAFEFKAGEEAAVIFRTTGAKGNVHIDAVQIVPAK